MVPRAYQKNLAGYAPAKESQLRKPDQNLNHSLELTAFEQLDPTWYWYCKEKMDDDHANELYLM